MPQFAYEARTEDGQLVGGIITAADIEEAGAKLSASNHFVVKLGLAGPVEPQDRARDVASTSRLKAKRRSVMWFISQLAIMIETGIAIGEALDVLARQASDPIMGEVLVGVSTRVQEGRPLSDALDHYPRTFPPIVTATIRASEASGTLSLVLARTAQYMVKDEHTVRRLRGSLMYPLFMFVMCFAVTLFLLVVILPRFAEIYSNRGALLPAPTRFLLMSSGFVMQYGSHMFLAACAIAFAAAKAIRTPWGRDLRDSAQLHLPLLGAVFNKFYQGRSFRTMGMLIEAGVPLSEVLELARSMSANTRYQKLWAAVHDGVTTGEHVATRMANFKFMPESIIHMIDCGDRAGRLSTVLQRLSEFIEEEYDQAMKTLCQFVEPLMIVLMGSIIGFVAISLLLPMFGAGNIMAQ
jgi:type IV pilus assembly protein PilC